jgi:hypothetical protein
MSTIQFIKFLELEQFPEDARPGLMDYLCTLCGGVYNDPLMGCCPHVFCKSCFMTSLKLSNKCPLCQKESDKDNLHPVTFIQTKILDKHTINCIHNCGWTGKSSDYSHHIYNDCPKQTVRCNNRGCNDAYSREEMKIHLLNCVYRPMSCKFCALKVAEIEMNTHLEQCPRYLVDCPQKCGDVVERAKIEEHMKSFCANALVSCMFKEIGCDSTLYKRDLVEHLIDDNIKHSELMMMFMLKTNDKINSLEKKIKENNYNNSNNNYTNGYDSYYNSNNDLPLNERNERPSRRLYNDEEEESQSKKIFIYK